MKEIVYFLCFMVCQLSVLSQSSRKDSVDVLHYIFELKLSDVTDSIIGKATVRLLLLKPVGSISLQLENKKTGGKGMTVSQVVKNNQLVPFVQKNDKIIIQLDSATGANDSYEYEIYYSGIPEDGLIIARNKFNHRTFFSDNWPNRAHDWIPCIDKPSDKASVEFIVTAPLHYQIIANGTLVEQRNLNNFTKVTHWRENVPIPTKVMVIGAADFAVDYCGTAGGVPVSSWVFPENKSAGFYDYAQALDILPFFIRNLAPFPFDKLANVQSKTIFGGMENASAIFYGENSITGTRKSESLLTHEIAHQWFGDFVTESDFSHLWLSEGFATYMTDLYFESKYGRDTLDKLLALQRAEVIEFSSHTNHPVVDDATTDYMKLLNPNNYQKGGWVLHMLRRRIGDSLFWKSIRRYIAEFGGKNATTRDFERIVESTAGMDLEAFFDQWLYSAELPKLDIAWKYDQFKKKVELTILQKQSRIFDLVFQVLFFDNNQKKANRFPIHLTGKTTTFEFPVDFQPTQIVVDPDTNLLFAARVQRLNH